MQISTASSPGNGAAPSYAKIAKLNGVYGPRETTYAAHYENSGYTGLYDLKTRQNS